MAKKSVLYDNFIGEHVEVVTKSFTMDQSGQVGSFAVQGFFLEEDDKFLYLGKSPLEVDKAINKEDITLISIQEIRDPYEEMLEEMDIGDEPGN